MGMGAQSETGEPESDLAVLWWILLRGLYPPGWRSVVICALRFIRKRGKISLAFNNYRNKPVKHDQPSQALLSRKRAERLEPLKDRPSVMEPTEAELNAITTLVEAFNWAGVSPEVRASLSRGLGNPGFIRDIVFVPRPAWDTVVGRTRGSAPPRGGAAGPPQPVELTCIDLARLEIFRRVCFRRIGATPDGMLGAAPTAVAPAPAPLAGSPSPRKLKLSAIVDQTLDAQVQPLDCRQEEHVPEATL